MRIGVREHFLFKEKEKVFQVPRISVSGPVPPGAAAGQSGTQPGPPGAAAGKIGSQPGVPGAATGFPRGTRAQELPAVSPVHRVLLPGNSVASPVYRVLLPGSPVCGPVPPGQLPGCSTLLQTSSFLSPTFPPTVIFALTL